MCHACMAAEMRMSRRSSWLPGPVRGRGHDHLRAWVHAPVWCKVSVACMHNKTPAGSTSPSLDPTTSPLHAIRGHLGPPSPAGVAAAPARVSVCDILHAQAVLHLLRHHCRRWRIWGPPTPILTGIYASIDDMMMGTRSLELELRCPAPASREHFSYQLYILNLVAAGPVLPSRRVLRLLGPCLPYLVRTGYIGRRFA